MMLSVVLALFLPCVGMSAVFLIYLFILWFVARREMLASTNDNANGGDKPGLKRGLSAEDLQKLPAVTGKELVLGTDCAVCLDEIGDEDAVIMVPGCNHGFHKECAEMWLMRSGECPLCRTKVLQPATNDDEADSGDVDAEVSGSSEPSPV